MPNLVSNEYYTNTYKGKYTNANNIELMLSRAQDDIQCEATTDITKHATNDYLLKSICAQAEYLDYNHGYVNESKGQLKSESFTEYSYTKDDSTSGVNRNNLNLRALRLLNKSGLRCAVLY